MSSVLSILASLLWLSKSRQTRIQRCAQCESAESRIRAAQYKCESLGLTCDHLDKPTMVHDGMLLVHVAALGQPLMRL